MSPILARLIAIAALLACNGYFVSAEFSLVRSRRTRLEAMARGGDRLARLALKASAELPRLLPASQLGITIASLSVGALAEGALGSRLNGLLGHLPFAVELSVRTGLAATLAIVVIAYFDIVFGELAPRSVALAHPEEMARWLAPPLMAFERVVRPFTSTLNGSANLVLRLIGQRPASGEETVHSPDELRILVEQSQEGGALESTDADLLEGVFEFSEKNALDVMTPRTEIDALDVEASRDEVIAFAEETLRSRYPIYEESIDNIVGLLLAKDLLRASRAPAHEFSLRKMTRPVHVVPGSREVEDVLADFKRLKEHMAVVLDEFGGTAGIITMEDLLEEIVGEILDEYDDPLAAPAREGTNTVVLPGSMHITEFNERFGTTLPEDSFTTIGGFVFGALGRLPVVGDGVTSAQTVFVVRAMDGRRVESVAVDLSAPGKDLRP